MDHIHTGRVEFTLIVVNLVTVAGLFFFLFFLFGIFYQLLRVQHSCSSTQSWGSVLPSIVETRQEFPGLPPSLFK